MKILNLGSCNIDYVYSMEHIVNAGETLSSTKLERFPGGKGLNQSIAASRAGADVYHGGCIGAGGGFLIDVMSKSGVDTSFVKKLDTDSGHAIIQVEKSGQNSIILFGGSNRAVTKEIIDEILSSFNEGDILILQNEISNVDYAVQKAYEKKMITVLNPSPFNDDIAKIDLSKVSLVILNEVEGACFAGSEEPEKIIKYFKTSYPDLKAVLTLGSKGSIFFDESVTCRCPAFSVDAVDTTAAGDTFTGYFTAEYFGGKDVKDALKIAAAAAALSVTKYGAASSIPYIGEVKKELPNLKIRE